MVTKLFEEALGIEKPWYITNLDFDPAKHVLRIEVDFETGAKFPAPGGEIAGTFGAYDTEITEYRHLSFFQHECKLSVRVPRIMLPDGRTRVITPPWSGKLHGFTLLFEAFVLLLVQHGMTFADAGAMAHISEYKAKEIAIQYTEEAVAKRSLADVTAIAVDETSRARGHNYVSLIADTDTRAVVDVQPGKDADVLEGFAKTLAAHGGEATAITDICMDMSPAFIAGAAAHFPDAQLTFDKFHILAHASAAVDETRREERRTAPILKHSRWVFLKKMYNLTARQRATFDALLASPTPLKTVRAWLYKEELGAILDHKQPNVLAAMLDYWCRRVNRSRLPEMKKVAAMIRAHWDGVVRGVRSRITNGFLEALNGLFQAAKRNARGYASFRTIRAVIFLIAGKLDYTTVNPFCFLPT